MKSKKPWKWQCKRTPKVLFLKLRTQRLKLGATQARQSICGYFCRESIEQDLDQLEEMLKGNQNLKEFVGVLREYHQANREQSQH